MKLPQFSTTKTKDAAPKPTQVHNIHWTTIGGFWIGAASTIVAVAFGVMSLSKPDRGKHHHRGEGWHAKRAAMMANQGDQASVGFGSERRLKN